MDRDLLKLKAALLSSAALAVSGCMSIAAIEPVKNPPTNYQADVSVQVEFLHPANVGARCAQRGVTLLGMPMSGAMACANPSLMTVPNPCNTVTGGWYAEVLCAEIGHTRGWDADKDRGEPELVNASWSPGQTFGFRAEPTADYRNSTGMRVEFVSTQDIGLRCAERGAVAFGKPTLNALSCSSAAMMTLPNPCSVVDGGWYADLLCHELGHTNGWPESHPGGSFLKDGKVPYAHSVPDDDNFVMNFVAAIQKAHANSHRGDIVRGTVLASLADDPVQAEQIALKAGIRRLPDIAVPRIEQIPDMVLASIVVPVERASLRTGPDFSRPMGPFAERRNGLRLTRKGLEALLTATPDARALLPEFAPVTQVPAEGVQQGWAKLQKTGYRPRLSGSLSPSTLQLGGALRLHSALPAGQPGWLSTRQDRNFLTSSVDQVSQEAPATDLPEPVTSGVTYASEPVWSAGFAAHPWMADRIQPMLPEGY